jgi:hypothetical protein
MALTTLVDIGRIKDVLFSAPGPDQLPDGINITLARLAKEATEEVERRCDRRFVPVAGLTSYYYPSRDRYINIQDVLVPIDGGTPPADAITVTVSAGQPTVPAQTLVLGADYTLGYNHNGTAYDMLRYRPFTAWSFWDLMDPLERSAWNASFPAQLAVTGTHGYSRVPPETIVGVAEAIAVRLYNMRRFAYQPASGNGASGATAPEALWDEFLLQRIEPYKRQKLLVV